MSKTSKNVQGDERDIIIFSIAYAYNEAGKLNTHFGLLSQRRRKSPQRRSGAFTGVCVV
ncbi:MAG: hypothetical protein R3B47_18545 [Bacteroidia bacterium]